MGTPLARYPKHTAKSCLKMCDLDARCVGFTIGKDPKVDGGLCTLRESWASNIDNPRYDSYQAHDYMASNLPFKDLVAFPKTGVRQRLLVIADITRVRPEHLQHASELMISIDFDHSSAIWTNVPGTYGEPEAFASASWAGVSPFLRSGEHTVRVQYAHSAETPVQGDDRAGCQQQRLTTIAFPIELGNDRNYELVGEHWNVAGSATVSAQTYANLPAPEMKISVATAGESRLFVIADISRVQHSNPWTNSAFRLLVDGHEIAYTNTGEHYLYQYRALSLRATSPVLKPGEHTIQVQAQTQQGRIHLQSDGNGFQQRRLLAIVVPNNLIWNRIWNLGTSWLNSRTWATLPGGAMQLQLTTPMAGRMMVNAAISRVQSWGTDNIELRITVDGSEIARTNTGNVNGWRFRDVTFHAVTELLQPGEHTVKVEFRSRAASTVVFYNDGNGWQQRRLTAILFSASAGLEHVKQFDNSGFCKNQR